MSMPALFKGRLSIPVIGSPLFIISVPDLVIAQCKAGVVGSFPALNARPAALLTNGWTWITPSPWVWMPTLACWPGLSAGFSNWGWAASHSPQMFTWNAVCQ